MCNHSIMDASSDVKPPKNCKILYDNDIVMDDIVPVIARDPRDPLAKLRPRLEPYELSVPRFSIDRNYVGEPPAREITITNLSDDIDEIFLKDLLQKCGTYENLYVFYHPATNKNLPLARVVFESVASATACIHKYNGTSIMGKALNVFHDAFGEKCKHIFEEATNENRASPAPPPAIVNETFRTDGSFLYRDHHRYYSDASVPPSSTSCGHQHQSTVTPIPPNDVWLCRLVKPPAIDVEERNWDTNELEKIDDDDEDQSMIVKLVAAPLPFLQMDDNYSEADQVQWDDDEKSNEETDEGNQPTIDLDTRIAMMLKDKSLPFAQMDDNDTEDGKIFNYDTNIRSNRGIHQTNPKSSNSSTSSNASNTQTKEMRKAKSPVCGESSPTSWKDDDEMLCLSLSSIVDEKESYVPSFPQAIPDDYLTKVDHYKSSITTAVNRTTVELKHTLKKDLNKNMIEHMAYKKFESWWDDNEQRKSKGSATIQTDDMTKVGKVLDTNQLLNHLDHGDGAAVGQRWKRIPKLPTYRRIHKVRSLKPKVKQRSICNNDGDGWDNDIVTQLSSKVSLHDKNKDATDEFKYRISKRGISSISSLREDKTSSDCEEATTETSIKTTSIANQTQFQTSSISLSHTNAFGEPMRPVKSSPSSPLGGSSQASQVSVEHSYSLPKVSSPCVQPMRPLKSSPSSSNSVLTQASRVAGEHSYSLPPNANHDHVEHHLNDEALILCEFIIKGIDAEAIVL